MNNCYDIEMDVYLYNSFKNFFSKQFPRNNKHGIKLFIINIIHFLLGIFNIIGTDDAIISVNLPYYCSMFHHN